MPTVTITDEWQSLATLADDDSIVDGSAYQGQVRGRWPVTFYMSSTAPDSSVSFHSGSALEPNGEILYAEADDNAIYARTVSGQTSEVYLWS